MRLQNCLQAEVMIFVPIPERNGIAVFCTIQIRSIGRDSDRLPHCLIVRENRITETN